MNPTKACPIVLRKIKEWEILAFQHPLAGFQLVKGTIEPGENPEAAAIRELAEEAGIFNAEVTTNLGLWESGHLNQIWSFHICKINQALDDEWTHHAADDGGHDFKFFWHPLAGPITSEWHEVFQRALIFINSALKANQFDNIDSSNGWNSIASKFIERRQNSHIGIEAVKQWASTLPSDAEVLDLGCGFGFPLSEVLINQGLNVHGIDASPELIKEFKRRFPYCNARCEPVEYSDFYSKTFDGVISIGLMFLLSPDTQIQLIEKVSNALKKGGRFLFTSPYQICTWKDSLTSRESISLGRDAYLEVLQKNGLNVIEEFSDDGGNHHFSAIKK